MNIYIYIYIYCVWPTAYCLYIACSLLPAPFNLLRSPSLFQKKAWAPHVPQELFWGDPLYRISRRGALTR